MVMEVKVGIVFTFRLSRNAIVDALRNYVINGLLRENIEQNLPEGWAMKVHHATIDGEKVELNYE
jgi:hypothetical protein